MIKYICSLAAVLFLFHLSLNAQGNDSTNSERNSLQKKSWAVQFAVGNDFQITSFQGLTFSLKYHLSTRSALRFGVGFSGELNDRTVEHSEYGEPTKSIPLEINNQDVHAVFSFLFYPKPEALIKIYFGIGPRFAYSHSLHEYPNSTSCGDYVDTYEFSSWAAGLEGTFGAEWFPAKILSIFAEYSAYGVYGKSTEDDHGFSCYSGSWHDKDTSENWEFNGHTARMGLSVYF